MKVLRNVLRAATLLAVAAALLAFFGNFVTVVYSGGTITLTGSMLLFGQKDLILPSGETVQLFQSLRYIVVSLLMLITAVLAGFSFKRAKAAFWALGFGIVSAIMFGFYIFNTATNFVDTRGIAVSGAYLQANKTYDGGRYLISVTYTFLPLIMFILLVAFVLLCVASIYVADKVEVAETGELSLIKKIGKFVRDYKNEIKKIVWPSREKVTRNSITVFVMTIIFGIFIVLVDVGLGAALKAILKLG